MSGPDLEAIERAALADAAAAATLAELEAARVAHTGRRSPLAGVLAGIGSLPPEERGPVGRAANSARAAVEAALTARQEALEADELGAALERDTTDVTLPGDPHPRGALHPITQIRREMEDIFLALGYFIADGPEVETEWHNFTALNTPEGHPARSSSDNFYVTGRPDRLLRSQTSPVQVRVMQEQPPPIYLVAPGFVYRRDDVDATHSPMFQQMEGLAVGRGPDHGPPQGHDAPLRPRAARHGPRDRAAAALLPLHRALGGRAGLVRRQGAGAPGGSSWRAPGWSTRTSSRRAASTPSATPASPSAGASTGSP